MDTVASRYSKALFDLAKETNQIQDYYQDMELVLKVFESDKSILSFFNHVTIQDKDKYQLLDNCFASNIQTYSLNFLKLLVKKRRMKYVKDIISQFIRLCHQDLGIEEGIVYTAYKLDDAMLQKLEEAMSKKEKKTIKLKQKIQEDLIGGVKVQMNSKVYDGSIKNKVSQLKQKLLESR